MAKMKLVKLIERSMIHARPDSEPARNQMDEALRRAAMEQWDVDVTALSMAIEFGQVGSGARFRAACHGPKDTGQEPDED